MTPIALLSSVLLYALSPFASAQSWQQSPVNGHWYLATSPLDWHSAEAFAVASGGHLATVRSQAENDWILATYYQPGSSLWIGYTDEALEGTFVWSSGEPTVYTNWHPGEPNNQGGEDYTALDTTSGTWNDGASHPLPSLIEVVSGDANGDGIPDVTQVVVNRYCLAAGNSFGPGAIIDCNYAAFVSANSFVLSVQGAVPNQFGLFFYGPQRQGVLWGEGMLCVKGSLHRLWPIKLADATGSASHWVDFTAPPANAGSGAITPSSTWNFQYWYRDPLGGPAGFNASDALMVTFQP